MDKNREYLYKLLYSALIQIREDAYENKNKKVFWISDLLHNLPLKLLKDDINYEEIFNNLRKDAEHNKIDQWFENEINFFNENS